MAEAAAQEVLVSDGHAGKTYDITNTKPFLSGIAEIISETSGRTVRYISPSVEDYGKTLAGFGVCRRKWSVYFQVLPWLRQKSFGCGEQRSGKAAGKKTGVGKGVFDRFVHPELELR